MSAEAAFWKASFVEMLDVIVDKNKTIYNYKQLTHTSVKALDLLAGELPDTHHLKPRIMKKIDVLKKELYKL